VEYVGAFAGNGFYGGDILSLGLYHDSYGLGVGTTLLQMRGETWDLQRKHAPDASIHGILIPLPLEARVVLASWEGDPFVDYVNVESSNARLELHGWYCPWAYFGAMTDVEPGPFGGPQRTQINDYVTGRAWDYGIGYDAGKLWGITMGRFEFQTRDGSVYRSRRDGRWYAMGRLYYGRTHGRTVGANPTNIFKDVAFKLCRLVGRCGIIED
jgi:hypothetical protein